ncbi:MAG: hypothetical protein ACAI35_25395 [Candidatus Methylacidiphilales bacterium]|nr:hypothetical protein [Candidatus Methylacidiphilales bacterium]
MSSTDLTAGDKGITRTAFAIGFCLCCAIAGMINAAQGGLLVALPILGIMILQGLRLQNMGEHWAWTFLSLIPIVSLFVVVPCFFRPPKVRRGNMPVAGAPAMLQRSHYTQASFGQQERSVPATRNSTGLSNQDLGLVVGTVVALIVMGAVVFFLTPRTPRLNTYAAASENSPAPEKAVKAPAIPASVTTPRPPEPEKPAKKYVTVSLPLGIKIDVPGDWDVETSKGVLVKIKPFGQSTKDLSQFDLSVPGGACIFKTGRVRTSTAVQVYAEKPKVSDEIIRQATEEQRVLISEEFRRSLEPTLAKEGSTITEMDTVWIRTIGKHIAMVISCKQRDKLGKNHIVKMTGVIVGDYVITVNTSYDVAKEDEWRPIIECIDNSIRVE